MSCFCGDSECPSCGTAQGTKRNEVNDVATFFEHLLRREIEKWEDIEQLQPADYELIAMLTVCLKEVDAVMWDQLHNLAFEFLKKNDLLWTQEEIDKAEQEARELATKIGWNAKMPRELDAE